MKKHYLMMLLAGMGISKASAQSVYHEILPRFNKVQPVGERCMESVLPFVDPERSAGNALSDTLSFYEGQELLRQVMWLKTSSHEDLEHLDSVRKSVEQDYISKNILPITVIDYKYKAMRDSIREYGLELDKDSIFQFKSGVNSASVFETKYVFNFVVPLEHVRSDFNQFVIDERLMLSNIQLNSKGKWFMKFGMTTLPIQLNVPFQVPLGVDSLVVAELCYEVPQEDVRLEFMENPWYNTSSTAKIVGSRKIGVNVSKEILDVFDGQGLHLKTVNAFPGLPDLRANISIHYGKNATGGLNTCIQKPIIFVEGIDFGYKGYPIGERDAKCGSMGYLDLLKGKQWNVETQKWETNLGIAQAPAILEKYRKAGYDIVYVDFFDGAADMDFNSEVLIKVIQEVQSTMCGENVHVVGVSMGGILAKMALKKMENRKLRNCVVSYTSFDAPQQGANIPLGVQRFVSHMRSISSDCKDIQDRMLRRPAARQLLVLHESMGKGHDWARQQYLRWDSLQGGYPKNMALLGISNGSGLGDKGVIQKLNGAALSPGDEILSIRFKVPIYSYFFKYFSVKTVGIYATHKKVNLNTALVAKIYGVTADKLLYSHVSNAQLDHVSGSWNGAVGAFKDFGKLGNIFIKSVFNTDKTTFVPTVSSLDIKPKNPSMMPIASDIYTKPFSVNENTFTDILGPKFTSPFQRIFVPKYNQEHVYLDSSVNGNAIWLLRELNRIDSAKHNTVVKQDYNFRSVMGMQVKSLELLNGSKFELNGVGNFPKISKSDSMLNRSISKRRFVSSSCGDSKYLISDSSEFCVGQKNGTTEFEMNNASKMILQDGGKLFLPTGSNKLILKEGSSLEVGENCIIELGNGSICVVESGASIYFKRGSKLILNGEVSQLHVKGKLILDSGVIFEPVGKLGSRVGMVKFTNVGYGYGDAKIVAKGKNASMKFVGNGKTAYANLQLEGKVTFPYMRNAETYGLAGIKVADSRVYFGANGAMIAGDSLTVESSHFESADWANGQGKGLVYTGEVLKISGSTFNKLDTAIRIQNSGFAWYNQLLNVVVKNCNIGVVQVEGGARVSSSNFENNKFGLIFKDVEKELCVEDCIFSDHDESGMVIENSSLNGKFSFVLRNEFLRNKIGLSVKKQHILSRCNYFTLNQIGLYCESSKLNLNKSIYKWSDILDGMSNGGNNSFSNNYTAAIELNNGMPFLEGNNNFNLVSNFSGSKIQVQGTVSMDKNQPYWDAATQTKVLIGLNYWSGAKSNFNADSIDLNFVDLKNANSGSSLKLYGGLSAKFSPELCLNAGKATDFDGELQGEKRDKTLEGGPDADILVKATSEGFSVEGENVQIYVYNTNGQVVFNGITKGKGSHFYHLSTGVYFVKVSGSAGTQSKKILVTN